jgi:hypothetical protein
MTAKPNPWSALERVPGQLALPGEWRSLLGGQFTAFRDAFLQPAAGPLANTVCCPRQPGVFHEVIPGEDGSFTAPCPVLPDECRVVLSAEELTRWHLNHARLGRALSAALGLDSKPVELGLYNTWQIGSCPADAVAVILTIQSEADDLLSVVARLVATLRQRFILLTPTNELVTAPCQALLANCGAATVPLNTIVSLAADGALVPTRPPGELFAQVASPDYSRSEITACRGGSLLTGPVIPGVRQCTNGAPRFALRKGLGVWRLVFAGNGTDLWHQRAVFFVAWLFYHPPAEPLHALDLTARIPEIYRQQLGLGALVDPATGKTAAVQAGARMQERSLALEDAEAMRALYRKEKELEAILESEDAIEPERAEALRELEEIYVFQERNARRSKDNAHRVADAVRKAISRFHRSLMGALDGEGKPHPVLRPFGEHVEKHLLIPSARYCGPGGKRARGRLAGCFTYEPPPGVRWES